jgi:hypothetical protein
MHLNVIEDMFFYVYIHYYCRRVYIKAQNFSLAQGPQNLRTGPAGSADRRGITIFEEEVGAGAESVDVGEVRKIFSLAGSREPHTIYDVDYSFLIFVALMCVHLVLGALVLYLVFTRRHPVMFDVF